MIQTPGPAEEEWTIRSSSASHEVLVLLTRLPIERAVFRVPVSKRALLGRDG